MRGLVRRARPAFAWVCAVVIAGVPVVVLTSGSRSEAVRAPETRSSGPPARATDGPVVVLYGDSALVQASAHLTAALAHDGWRVQLNAFPGLALCDWFPDFDRTAALSPTIVVFAVSGNVGLNGDAACSSGRGDREAVYATDTRVAAQFWRSRGTSVLWVDAPSPPAAHDDVMVPLLRQVTAEFGQSYADTTFTLRGPDLSWPLRIPCTDDERRDGHCDDDGMVQTRRGIDNYHPCPVGDTEAEYTGWGPCPVYATAIVRWSSAINGAIDEVVRGSG